MTPIKTSGLALRRVYASNIGQRYLGKTTSDYVIMRAHDADIPLIHEQYLDR